MRYRAWVDASGDYIETNWFVRSIEAIFAEIGYMNRPSVIRKRYEETYDVKLVFDEQYFITAVDFRSRDHATEFILRWT